MYPLNIQTFNCVLVLADIFNRQSTKRIHLSYCKFCIYWVGANLQYDTSPNVTFTVNGSGRPEVSNQLMSPVHSDVGVVTKPLTSKLTPLFKKFSTLQYIIGPVHFLIGGIGYNVHHDHVPFSTIFMHKKAQLTLYSCMFDILSLLIF